jgi:hypothetical protein
MLNTLELRAEQAAQEQLAPPWIFLLSCWMMNWSDGSKTVWLAGWLSPGVMLPKHFPSLISLQIGLGVCLFLRRHNSFYYGFTWWAGLYPKGVGNLPAGIEGNLVLVETYLNSALRLPQSLRNAPSNDTIRASLCIHRHRRRVRLSRG